MKKIIKFFVKKWFFIVVILIIVVVVFFFLNKNGQYETINVKAQDFVSEISVVGTVIPAQETNMAFDMSGRVSAIYKKIGDKINQGEQILSLESAGTASRLLKAEADYDAELAKLNKLKNNNSTTDLVSIKNAVRTGYTAVDDAIRSKVDQFFENPNSRFPELKFFISKSEIENKLEENRYDIRKNLESLSKIIEEINSVNSVSELKEKYVPVAKNELEKVLDFLDLASFSLSISEPNSEILQSDLDKYSSDVSTARTNVNKVIAELNSAISSVADTSQEIPYQEARVKSALASIKENQAELSKNKIIAPFSGIITKIDVEIGEIVGNTDSAVSIISDNAFQIETFVPEVNVKDLKIGDTATVRLDAFDKDEIFEAKVISIEPAQTVRDGVATYKTKFEFNQKDERIRSGMTANVVITTEKRADAILINPSSIYKKDGVDYVKILVDKTVIEKQITIGGFDSVGNREILSGLSVGEKVLKNPNN